jgi:hypothetical protein
MLRAAVCCVSFITMLLGLPATAICVDNQEDPGKRVIQSVPPGIPVNPPLPTLHLTDAQRAQIRKVLVTKHTDIQFRLKSTEPAKDFTPAVGATLPKGVEAQALPHEVTAQIPELRSYQYVVMKDQVLIVNGMSRKIVDMFSTTQPAG